MKWNRAELTKSAQNKLPLLLAVYFVYKHKQTDTHIYYSFRQCCTVYFFSLPSSGLLVFFFVSFLKNCTGRMLNNLLRIKAWVQGTKIKAMDTDATTICLAVLFSCFALLCFALLCRAVLCYAMLCSDICLSLDMAWPSHRSYIMVVTFSYKWHT